MTTAETPPRSLGVILRDPSAILVHRSKAALCHGRVPAGSPSEQLLEPLDLDLGQDVKRFAADWAVHDPAHRLWHVAVAAAQPAALKALPGLAVVVLVLEADRARVRRVVGVVVTATSTGRHRWGACWCRSCRGLSWAFLRRFAVPLVVASALTPVLLLAPAAAVVHRVTPGAPLVDLVPAADVGAMEVALPPPSSPSLSQDSINQFELNPSGMWAGPPSKTDARLQAIQRLSCGDPTRRCQSQVAVPEDQYRYQARRDTSFNTKYFCFSTLFSPYPPPWPINPR